MRHNRDMPEANQPSPYGKRPAWNEYFMRLAREVSSRATCDRKHVGCAIVDDENAIVATGYNGSPPGMPHCDDVGHDMFKDHCVRTTHAEVNAVAQAARRGISLRNARAYINTFPCWPCFKVLVTAGIRVVYFDDEYRRDERVENAAKEMGVVLYGPKAWRTDPPL